MIGSISCTAKHQAGGIFIYMKNRIALPKFLRIFLFPWGFSIIWNKEKSRSLAEFVLLVELLRVAKLLPGSFYGIVKQGVRTAW